MEQLEQPTSCPKCRRMLVERKGVSKKTGKPYYFLACTGWKSDGTGCDYTWNPPKAQPTGTPNELKELVLKILQNQTELKRLITSQVVRPLDHNPDESKFTTPPVVSDPPTAAQSTASDTPEPSPPYPDQY